MKNAKEILTEHLKENGYVGLCFGECGCGIDDLMPCDYNCKDCVPAKRKEYDKHQEMMMYYSE